jgi:hypothetical protein
LQQALEAHNQFSTRFAVELFAGFNAVRSMALLGAWAPFRQLDV